MIAYRFRLDNCGAVLYAEKDRERFFTHNKNILCVRSVIMQAIRLAGVLVVIAGFVLKKDTLATIVAAGLVTGLVSGMSAGEILNTLGSAFLSQRIATLFVLTLPAIGLCERFGLRDKATDFISRLKSATTGRVVLFYLVIRAFASAFSLRVGGHPQFVRPLVAPMALGAAQARFAPLSEDTEDKIKGLCAAADNYGNFFAQNCFMGASGTLLIVTTLTEQGFAVDPLHIAAASIPAAIAAVLCGAAYCLLFDRKLKAGAAQ